MLDQISLVSAVSARSERHILVPSHDEQIRDFLSGETDGEDVLHALFDKVMDEPIPESMLALLRRG